jgi:hypothetical protein
MLPRLLPLAVLLAAPVAVAADATTYIGVLAAEPPALIAVVVEGETFLAYACGKTDEFNQAHSAWFKGKVENGLMEATAGEKTFTASLEKGTVRGSLGTDGRAKEFAAKPVAATAIAGLYRATREVDGDTLVFGWIVDAKHRVAGGCQGKKRKAVALQPAAPLPPPPPADEPPPAEQVQQAEEFIVSQVGTEPDVAVQGEKVKSAINPPGGKVVNAAKKK